MRNLEQLLRELRLMKDQPNHRYYAALGIVVLALFRHPIISVALAVIASISAKGCS
ncbi:hypothetical protein [Denitromonas iodatirespirans]|uniref:Uncharacterized protein n=1 Tax=Denitromonas iodatirespirans TaxID=2795389 RepID=A0A944DCW2_DENI1|nr:hypothetical protein [Denitromonas iodatirespirans]MBT0963905.1 hypothetical protein [Denitromonas iodatirespirans]